MPPGQNSLELILPALSSRPLPRPSKTLPPYRPPPRAPPPPTSLPRRPARRTSLEPVWLRLVTVQVISLLTARPDNSSAKPTKPASEVLQLQIVNGPRRRVPLTHLVFTQ